MRKFILLIIAVGAVVWLQLDGLADSAHVDLRVQTSAGDVVVTETISGSLVAGSSTSSLVPLSDPGRPQIPFRVVRVLLPEGQNAAGVSASVRDSRILSRSIRPVLATEPAATDGSSRPDVSVSVAPSNGGQEFPSQPARLLGTGTWHGYTIANVAVFPVQVRGAELVLHTDIDVRVQLEPNPSAAGDVLRAARASERIASIIAATVRDGAENSDAVATYPRTRVTPYQGDLNPTVAPSEDGSPVEYLIITTEAMKPAFQVLADWKTAKGVPSQVRTVEWIQANSRRGSDLSETIRFFLQDAYASWGIRYVLLAGDTPEIPPRYLYSAYHDGGTLIPADIYFACLDGTFNADKDSRFGEQPADAPDLYPELVVGRLPVSTPSDAAIVVDKIIAYETPLNTQFNDRVLMLAEVLAPSPWSGGPIFLNGADVTEVSYLLRIASPNRRVDRLYETPWLYPTSKQLSRAIAFDSLQTGYSQIFHVGHGFRFNMHCADDNIAIPEADAMQSPDKYFNLFMLNCTAAAFDYDCFGEHLLRNPSGGAVSVVGAVNSAFPDVAAIHLDEYARALYVNGIVRLGDTFHASRIVRTPFATADNVDLWTHYIYTVLGDPEMPVWTTAPRALQVIAPASLAAGDHTISVTVNAGGTPVPGATVCLRKSNEDYRVGITNISGSVNLPFAAPSVGSIDVVVTGTNLVRTASTIQVTAPVGALVKLVGLAIDDDNSGGTVGNGDGALDAGEVVDLTPSARNFGNISIPQSTVVLSSTSPYVTVIDASAQVPPLAGNQTASATDRWRIGISSLAPDFTTAPFQVSITAGPSSWVDSFERVLHAPSLEITRLRKSDSPPVGNGDGTITPGEQFRLYFALKNFGSGAARGLTAVLRSTDGGATVIDSLDVFANIPPLGTMENTAGFRLSEANVTIENDLKLIVTDARGAPLQHVLELRGPSAPIIQSFNPSMGIDKMTLTWSNSASPDALGYHVYRATAAGGPFVRASTDAVSNTLFTDSGLTPNTRYYYAVTSLDASGNESPFSPVASASTNPPQLYGWPHQLTDPSANSPSVGDIDLDGDFEVIVGNDRVYAWQYDGDEIVDGDGQPLTWGVISPLGDDFIGPSVLADFDNSPGLEIVAAAYTTKQVYVFNAAGQVLPGWPQPTVDLVRASVAAGDIDGDGDLEILAIDQEAYLYAWHANGTEVRDGDLNPATLGVFRRFPDTNQLQYQAPALADIDSDGKDEVIVATQDMKLYVLNETGADQAGWPRTLPNYVGGGVVVGDIDGNGDLELVVTTRNTGETYALNHDNTVMWQRWLQCNLFFNPSPALADLTGDGKLEALIPASNGRLYAVQYNGSDVPGWPVIYSATTYTESSPVVADINGDGAVDVVLGDEAKNINAWNANGTPVDGFPLVLKDSLRGTPAITDLDRDGDVEIIAVGYDRTVYVWDLPAPFNPSLAPWPTFRANIHRTGRYGYDPLTPVDDTPRRQHSLAQNYPNPFNPTTTIIFELPSASRASLIVYDVTGARVRTLVDGAVRAGRHRVVWDGKNDARQPVGSGVYFYRLVSSGKSLTKKMVLLK
ncbi:MAG TPA: C25 family cysteine peptidase [Candidatus Krumholzibacteria bacterium]|nr:C25 family cysteine peptidase [Candidatus Krumholzibacteria bacterium]